VLSWTNPPITPTTWTAKRSTTSADLCHIATNINSGVQAIKLYRRLGEQPHDLPITL